MAITYAAMITVITGFAGLAVDAGYLQWNQRRVQVAADAAALGGLREMERQRYDYIEWAAHYNATLNGFTNGQNGTTVQIYSPPQSGAYQNRTGAVQAVIRRSVPTMFMRVFGPNSVTVAADAVALTTESTGSVGGCIYALNKTMRSSFKINGTTVNVYTNCSIVVESDHGEAFTMGGGAILNLGTEARVGVVGGWFLSGQSQILDNSVSPPVAEIPINISDPGDPFQLMEQPSPSNVDDLTVRGNNVSYNKNHPPADNEIEPGVYCGGLRLGDSDGVTYTFKPGVYVLAGGGMDVSSDARAQGTGITFFNTRGGSAWGCGNSNYAPITIAGHPNLNFTAPTSGPFVAMLFFQDRSITDNRDNQITGGASASFNGALYFKTTSLKFAGGSATNGYLVIVADSIDILGTSSFNNNYTTLEETVPFAPYTTGSGLVE